MYFKLLFCFNQLVHDNSSEVQESSLLEQIQELSLRVLCYQVCYCWLNSFSYPLQQGKGGNSIITPNSMALQKLFVLKQYRSSCLCSSFMLIISFPEKLPHPWCYHECCHPLTLKRCALLMITTKTTLIQSMQGSINDNSFSDQV